MDRHTSHFLKKYSEYHTHMILNYFSVIHKNTTNTKYILI